MTDDTLNQEFAMLRGHVQRLDRIVKALEDSPAIKAALTPPPPPVKVPTGFAVRTLDEAIKQVTLETLAAVNNDARQAARCLGIGRTTMYRYLRDWGIEPPRTRRMQE